MVLKDVAPRNAPSDKKDGKLNLVLNVASILFLLACWAIPYTLGWWDEHKIRPAVSMRGKVMLNKARVFVAEELLPDLPEIDFECQYLWCVRDLGATGQNDGSWTFATEGNVEMTICVAFTRSEARVFWVPLDLARGSQDSTFLRMELLTWCSSKDYPIFVLDKVGRTIWMSPREFQSMLEMRPQGGTN